MIYSEGKGKEMCSVRLQSSLSFYCVILQSSVNCLSGVLSRRPQSDFQFTGQLEDTREWYIGNTSPSIWNKVTQFALFFSVYVLNVTQVSICPVE